MTPFSVFARWRPLTPSESPIEIPRTTSQKDTSFSISLTSPCRQNKPWTSGASFTQIFNPTDTNQTVFQHVVAPYLPQVLNGETCNFFAYGHSGSGKSHTIIGYDYEHSDEFGLCLSAAYHIFTELDRLNAQNTSKQETDPLGLGLRIYELRHKTAFDLLNARTACHIRSGADGRTHIRGETETLENGKVRVRPIQTKSCWSFEDLRRSLLSGLALRATGSSSVHDQSSRTHAVLDLEIITKSLLDARKAVIERQSELVPVGKRATDIYIEETAKGVIKTAEGKYIPNPAYQVNQALINEAEAEKARFEERVQAAENHIIDVTRACPHKCLSGKLIFVDLAGSEYYHDKSTLTPQASSSLPKQTPQEQREGRQINTDLLALKEVIRALATNQPRIPFRSSPLTMVLREHFVNADSNDGNGDGGGGHSAMILTVSPAADQYAATMNTLKYGNLMGGAGMKR